MKMITDKNEALKAVKKDGWALKFVSYELREEFYEKIQDFIKTLK